MVDFLDPNLSWAVYVERQSDDDYDLAAVMPANERYEECTASDDGFHTETLAYHLAHELAAALQHNGAGAVIIPNATGDFADVLTGDDEESPRVRPRIFSNFRSHAKFHPN